MPPTPNSDRPRRTFVCNHCNSDLVVRDAWAEWSSEDHEWQLGQVFDHTFCLSCEIECRLVPKETEPLPANA